jgi:hypothetical protein
MSSQISSIDNAALASVSNAAVTQKSSGDKSAFQQMLNSMLQTDSGGQVNEEQLFSAIINERLTTQAGEDAASEYRKMFAEFQQEMQRADGYIPVEDAANMALEGLVEKGMISQEQFETVQNQAFTAAQIDGNSNALYDSRGTTVAVTLINMALQSAEETINGLADGTITPSGYGTVSDSVSKAGEGNGTFVGGDGFLYKPVSESNGNLVILLPSSMQGSVASINLLDGAGNSLETGQSYGPYDDGRPLFRFGRTGAAYPDNLTVQVNLSSGDVKEYTIPDSAKRWT